MILMYHDYKGVIFIYQGFSYLFSLLIYDMNIFMIVIKKINNIIKNKSF